MISSVSSSQSQVTDFDGMKSLPAWGGARPQIAVEAPMVIGVEGLPYAGKSTVISRLHQAGMSRLGELAEFFENGGTFPRFSERTADARESFEWFVNAEVARHASLASFQQDAMVVADRTIVSCLAYSYARRATFSIGDIDLEHSAVREAVQAGKLYIPQLLYVRIPIDVYLYRKAHAFDVRCEVLGREAVENVTLPDRERDFFEAQLVYYDTIARRLRDLIHVVDGTLPPDELARVTLAHCQDARQKDRALRASGMDSIKIPVEALLL